MIRGAVKKMYIYSGGGKKSFFKEGGKLMRGEKIIIFVYMKKKPYIFAHFDR